MEATKIAGSLRLKVSQGGFGLGAMYVYSDGLVIVLGHFEGYEASSPQGVTRLSPSGLDRLLSTAVDSAAIDGDDIPAVPGGGVTVYKIEVSTDAGITHSRQVAGPYRKSDRAAAIEFIALVERLITLDRWLPADGWIDADPVPWIPGRFEISIRVVNDSTTSDLKDLAEIDWPFEGGPRDLGEAVEAAEWVEVARCGTVGLDAALALGAALAVPGDEVFDGIDIELRDGADRMDIRVHVLLPDDPIECSPA